MRRQRRVLMVSGLVAAFPLVPAITSAATGGAAASVCDGPTATVPVDEPAPTTEQAPTTEPPPTSEPAPASEPAPTTEVVTSTSEAAQAAPTTESVVVSSVVESDSSAAHASGYGLRTDRQEVSVDPAPPPREVYRFTIPKLNIPFTPFKDQGKGPCGSSWELESNGRVNGRDRWILTVSDLPPDRTCTVEVIVVDSKGVRRRIEDKDLTIKRLKTVPPGPETTHMIEFTHPVNNLDGGTVDVKLSCVAPAP